MLLYWFCSVAYFERFSKVSLSPESSTIAPRSTYSKQWRMPFQHSQASENFNIHYSWLSNAKTSPFTRCCSQASEHTFSNTVLLFTSTSEATSSTSSSVYFDWPYRISGFTIWNIISKHWWIEACAPENEREPFSELFFQTCETLDVQQRWSEHLRIWQSGIYNLNNFQKSVRHSFQEVFYLIISKQLVVLINF